MLGGREKPGSEGAGEDRVTGSPGETKKGGMRWRDEVGGEDGEEQVNGKAEEGGVSWGRPALGGRAWPGTLVPCEQQPPAALCPQPGLPPCCRRYSRRRSFSPPRPPPVRLPARAGSLWDVPDERDQIVCAFLSCER